MNCSVVLSTDATLGPTSLPKSLRIESHTLQFSTSSDTWVEQARNEGAIFQEVL
jgi:hypothetical protein